MRLLLPFALAVGISLSGCADTTVDIGEVRNLDRLAVARVAISSRVRAVGADQAGTGVARTARHTVRFAVLVGDDRPARAAIDGTTYRMSSGCAGAAFYSDRPTDSLSYRIEHALYHQLAPDATCDG